MLVALLFLPAGAVAGQQVQPFPKAEHALIDGGHAGSQMRPLLVENLLQEMEDSSGESSRLRNALIGAAVGLSVGYVIGWAADAQQDEPASLDYDPTSEYYYRIRAGAVGLALGAVVGWVVDP